MSVEVPAQTERHGAASSVSQEYCLTRCRVGKAMLAKAAEARGGGETSDADFADQAARLIAGFCHSDQEEVARAKEDECLNHFPAICRLEASYVLGDQAGELLGRSEAQPEYGKTIR